MEQKKYSDPTKSPVIQEIIISNHIGVISMELAKRLDIPHLRALKLLYESKVCADLNGLYLYGDRYIAAEYMLEM